MGKHPTPPTDPALPSPLPPLGGRSPESSSPRSDSPSGRGSVAHAITNVASIAAVATLAALGTVPPLYALGALVLIAAPTHAGNLLAFFTGRNHQPK